jgi:SAM-dependent methyltransferase
VWRARSNWSWLSLTPTVSRLTDVKDLVVTEREVPSPWVVRFAPLVDPRGLVLDVACGRGRHTREFAQRGCRVLAVDIDSSAGAVLASLNQVEFVCMDLEAKVSRPGLPGALANRRFDAIVVTRYLHRPLMACLAYALAPGGLLLYETFAQGQQRFGRPVNPDFLLNAGELLTTFAMLDVIAYEDGVMNDSGGYPSRLQRLCARRAT